MNNIEIEKVLENGRIGAKKIQIHFKQRTSIEAYFVQAPDYSELKQKNFWRVVNTENISQWEKTRNINLTRIFNGNEFSKLR